MRTLVTGGAGFIGSHLVAELLRGGAPVTVLDNLRRGSIEALANCFGDFVFIHGDIRNPSDVRDAMQGVGTVYHLAAQSSVMNADSDTDYTLATNVEGTRNVLDAAAAEAHATGRALRVVFSSSREVYGDPESLPVSESAPFNPKNTYGVSKALGESLCDEFAASPVSVSILRLANVYGPGDRDRVLPIFLDNALADRPLQLFGGQQVLDFLWIDDAVQSLIRAAELPPTAGPINVGSGQGITVAQLAERVVAATGSRSPIEIAPARGIEVARFIADVTKAKRLLDLQPPADPLFKLAEVVRCVRVAAVSV